MSETTTRILDGCYELTPNWRSQDSVVFDEDSWLDEDVNNNNELDENDTSDDSNTSEPQSESHSEDNPLLQSSPQRVTTRDHFPDTPTHTILDGWNLTQKSNTVNNRGSLTAGTTTSGVDLLDLEGPLLHVMDRIEDEVEAHAYEDLVPLDIKLAIEDRVFGWTHFTSSFFGHIAFIVGAYLLVYHGFTFIWMQTFARGRTGSEMSEDVVSDSIMAWYWELLRTILALWASGASYRMVRRRRHVWFRAPYGSKAYKQDGARRIRQVRETDRSTRLGKMIRSIRHRRVLKTLRKAENRFAKKHNKTVRLRRITTSTTGNDDIHEPDAPTVLEGSSLLSSTESTRSCSSSEDEDEMSSDKSCESASSSRSDPNSSISELQKKKEPSFSTMPTNRMKSFAHDQVMFPTIQKMPYAHGAYFGSAPFLLSNPHWISILRHLMPDVYVEISRRVVNAPASRLIHWAENNPVVAAYASVHELEYGDSKHEHAIPNMEWDVFLDPKLVQRVQIVLDERDKFLASCKNGGGHCSETKTDKSQQILSFYQRELDQRAKALVDKMLIAHGNLTQLFLEQTGYVKNYNYSRVKRTRRTLGGGIYARQWMAVFAEAMQLGTGYVEEDQKDPNKRRLFHQSKSLLDLAESKCPDSTIAESLRLLQKLTKSKQPVGLVLDIKSRHVASHIWSLVIDTLRKAGLGVEGIASFYTDEIRHVSEHCVEPVQEIIFCHSAGDLQKACDEGKIRDGDSVFFNAGSLLWDPSPEEVNRITNFDPNEIKAGYRIQSFGKVYRSGNSTMAYFSTIQMYKERFNLRIGLYCQEFAIDEAALAILSKYVNDNPDIYDLGFAWGGINGVAIGGIRPGRFTATDGLWNQRYIGELWHDTKFPPCQVSGQYT